jgi:hypothetical protein
MEGREWVENGSPSINAWYDARDVGLGFSWMAHWTQAVYSSETGRYEYTRRLT